MAPSDVASVAAPARVPAAWLAQAARNLPRYTSYPTALAFGAAEDDATARDWLQAIRPDQALSIYTHVPFCRRLCWYCGCHTTVVHEYGRVRAYYETLRREIDLWAEALPEHAGARHLHFGGGSPNALGPADFADLVERLRRAFSVTADAEVAAELDPGMLSPAFIDAAIAAGVNRVSLGVQTFDPEVQRRVNRIQPFDRVAAVVGRLRWAGVKGLNLDLMYGLPGQTPENVAASVRDAVTLEPDRVAVFGYAHVPWMKKHQVMIDAAELADAEGRWAQADAADQALVEAGYVRIGLDHYARPDDPLAVAAASGRLRRNFQGYTDDPAPVMIPVGPSSIGRFGPGFVQNAAATDVWTRAVEAGRLPVARTLAVTEEDELRAAVIERLMCDLQVDVGAVCAGRGFPVDALDAAFPALAELEALGLCRVRGRMVQTPAEAARLVRAVAACFDARLPDGARRHAAAV
ncbi:MAG: oxygen-independent coproporphyrinogen III oxidase [Brevundimonas sp.]|uniref:oxygen-independent coproporphyrinogen III oxidase n=1 Tax=Brevundimonas sp. TaxID=1871086 RepID=UPI0017E370FD|nr:oxygen-independent coproporphyrinogen III oxidase [Brevundimonas sp.]MBA4805722.1 oxygen-independent coproporphyrinogen III oxidase [Brevundimonas sp.]